MKIVAVSDLHGNLPEIPACDLLLLAGDLCPISNHAPDYQAEWLDTRFRHWLQSLRHVPHVIGVAGNHDFVFEQEPARVPNDLPWEYLQDSSTEYQGLKIWGTPWQTWFHDWAFNGLPDQLQQKWELIPADTDVLVVHGPPHGYGDAVARGDGVQHTGCPHLLARIEKIRPELVVFGHIHEGRGQWQLNEDTTLANVALLDAHYQAVHSPWVYLSRARS
jgi:Icc-related predicted phosphoesterase